MKHIKYLMLLMSVLLLATACQREEDNIFSDTPEARMQKAIAEYKTLLTGSSDGWLMDYYPEKNHSTGGYGMYAKFNTDGTVGVACEIKTNLNAFTSASSEWDITGEQGPLLTFYTFNEVMHYFSDPKQSDIDGLGGDYEFTVMRAVQDTIVLKGKKNYNKLVMYRVKSGQDPIEVLKQSAAMTDLVAGANNFKILKNGAQVATTAQVSNVRVLRFTSKDADNKDVTESITYTFTPTGIRLYEPVVVEGVALNAFSWDDETKTYTATDANVELVCTDKISAKPTLPPGAGTDASPYLVSKVGHLLYMANELSAVYKLTADIDLAEEVWKPISTASANPFKGKLNGNGYAIKNISMNTMAPVSGQQDYFGLFGVIGDGAIIENVHMVGGSITITNDATHVGAAFVGGIVAYIYNNTSGDVIIRNCSSTVTIDNRALGNAYTGGIAGYPRTNTSGGNILISNCYVNAAISATESSGEAHVGGIVGRPTVSTGTSGSITIDKCFAAGTINTGTANGNARVGGIAGRIYGNTTAGAQYIIISNCVAALESMESGGTAHRIYASHTTNDMLTLTNNYAYADMLVKGAKESSTSTTSNLGANKTLVELQTQSTYATGLGWDFTNTWTITAGEFPRLK
jgi:hypothetical protein